MTRLLITNALTVNEGRSRVQDVLIRDGRIHALGADLSGRSADRHIEADGRALLPGMMDDQVHFRQPGMIHKGDIASESRSAMAGGITSFMEMPNTAPPTTTLENLEEKHRIASQNAFANFSFYLGGANDNIETIKRLDPRQACGIKVFMGARPETCWWTIPWPWNRSLPTPRSSWPRTARIRRRSRPTHGDFRPSTGMSFPSSCIRPSVAKRPVTPPAGWPLNWPGAAIPGCMSCT
ncbi:hypothetical protein [Desulfosarcina cetonica]|uniref:hypothetical protein n=1 Tax=Desulfosarcina cetonica TaxID=90730 RepID=UPI000A7C796E|nr:hypothetical protein [Desulfosarcina cetonica]